MIYQYQNEKEFIAAKKMKVFKEKDVVLIGDEKTLVYNGQDWENPKVNNKGISMSNYDLMRSAIGSLPTLKANSLNKALKEINTYDKQTKNKTYLLLNNDKHYYTILNRSNKKNIEFHSLGSAVLTLMKEKGDIKQVSLSNDKQVIEIWLYIKEEDLTYCFLLFGYDDGVVDFN